jgi:hypothetical protein
VKSFDFRFDLDEMVTVELTGEKGIITMLGVYDSGIMYVVKTKEGSSWWKEKQIQKV